MELNTLHNKRIGKGSDANVAARRGFARFSQRDGALAFAVLACIVVMFAIAISTMTMSVRHRQQTKNETRIEQTRWLLDAGVRTAISKVQADPQYRGERIEVETELPVFDCGIVQIEAEKSGDKTTLKVVAELVSNRDSAGSSEDAAGGRTARGAKKFKRSANLTIPTDSNN